MSRPRLTRRLDGFGTSIFAEMTALARRHDAINLGQGFPNFDGPDFVKQAAIEAMRARPQPVRPDARPAGAAAGGGRSPAALLRPRRTTPRARSRSTPGPPRRSAPRSPRCSIPGDEVIVFEPFYDAYLPGIAMAQAEARVVPLTPPEFRLDAAALEAAISAKTRLVLLNSPSNPACSVFTRAELETIAALAVRHDLVVVTDEVYEHIVFEGAHVPIASLPGMRERTRLDLVVRQDLQPDRLEDRLVVRGSPARGRGARGAPVRDVRGLDAVPARGRGRARDGRRLLRGAAGRTTGRVATGCATGSRRRASASAGPRAPTSRSPTCGRSASRTTARSAATWSRRSASRRSR